LVDVVDSDKAQVKKSETIEFNDINHRSRLHDAVYKRRIINAIITGGATRLSFISKKLIGELYDICPELPQLYRKISILNDYLLFTKNNMGMSEKNKKQSGISYLTIGNETTKNKIIVADSCIIISRTYIPIKSGLEIGPNASLIASIMAWIASLIPDITIP
jgi:hypothetical protein